MIDPRRLSKAARLRALSRASQERRVVERRLENAAERENALLIVDQASDDPHEIKELARATGGSYSSMTTRLSRLREKNPSMLKRERGGDMRRR